MKKWFSALLALVMMVSLLPTWSYAANEEVTFKTGEWIQDSDFIPGVIPEENSFVYPTAEQIAEVYPDTGLYAAAAKYDSRQYQTPVKNQASNGLCWTFATCATLESYMLKNGKGVQDFSELNMGYATSAYEYNGRLVNEKYGYALSDGYRTPGDGGNRDIAAAYLMRGELSGMVEEADDPYISAAIGSIAAPYRDPKITAGKTKALNVQDIIYLTGYKKATEDESTLIKDAVVKYGAVGVSTQWSDYSVNEDTAAYYMTKDIYRYLNEGGHAITIVGWDDNYSRDNFGSAETIALLAKNLPDDKGEKNNIEYWTEQCKPAKDGAWIVKNSWGESWGDNGYFYVSYEDYWFPYAAFVFEGMPSKWNPSTSYIYESDIYEDWYWDYEDTDYVKAYQIEEAGQTLKSVRVLLHAGGTVQVDVIPEFKGLDSLKNYKFSAKATSKVAFPGWYTIDLNKEVALPDSGKFAVVVRASNGAILYCDHDTPLGNTEAYGMIRGQDKSYVDYNFQGDGETWPIWCNFCIKAVCERTAAAKPEAPAKPSAKVGTGEITVSWKAVEGATDYVVYRRTFDASAETWGKWSKAASNLMEPTFTDAKVEDGVSYQYRVRAHNAAGYSASYSPASTKVTARGIPEPVAPSAPSVKLVNDDTAISVSWDDVNAVAYYAVRWVNRGDSKWSFDGFYPEFDPSNNKFAGHEVTVTSFVDEDVKAGYTYSYRVYAIFRDGRVQCKEDSEDITVPAPTSAPEAPAKPVAKAAAGVINLKWRAVDEAESYLVYRREMTDSSWGKWVLVGENVSGTTFADKNVTAGTTYQYCLKAVNMAGKSAKSPNSTAVKAK